MTQEEKGLFDLLGEAFDECAGVVEELTGAPSPSLRKGARVCRKAKKTAVSLMVAGQKAQRILRKRKRVVGYRPYITEE